MKQMNIPRLGKYQGGFNVFFRNVGEYLGLIPASYEAHTIVIVDDPPLPYDFEVSDEERWKEIADASGATNDEYDVEYDNCNHQYDKKDICKKCGYGQ